jgi:hypothetical protein
MVARLPPGPARHRSAWRGCVPSAAELTPVNIGPPVNLVRDRIVARGITINALTILNEWPTLDQYFENNVVGGQAHFVIPADDYVAYAEAIYRKLLREIVGPGIS